MTAINNNSHYSPCASSSPICPRAHILYHQHHRRRHRRQSYNFHSSRMNTNEEWMNNRNKNNNFQQPSHRVPSRPIVPKRTVRKLWVVGFVILLLFECNSSKLSIRCSECNLLIFHVPIAATRIENNVIFRLENLIWNVISSQHSYICLFNIPKPQSICQTLSLHLRFSHIFLLVDDSH